METKMPESTNGKSRGQLTAKMARKISAYWEEHGYSVLYDHDPSSENVRKIVSSFGEQPYGRGTQLSQVDIAIVEKSSDRVFALIEIEETSDKPETFLGEHEETPGRVLSNHLNSILEFHDHTQHGAYRLRALLREEQHLSLCL